MPLFLLSHRLNKDHYILKYNSNPFHGRDLVTRYQRTQYNKHRTTILIKVMNRIGYNEIMLHGVIKTD